MTREEGTGERVHHHRLAAWGIAGVLAVLATWAAATRPGAERAEARSAAAPEAGSAAAQERANPFVVAVDDDRGDGIRRDDDAPGGGLGGGDGLGRTATLVPESRPVAIDPALAARVRSIVDDALAKASRATDGRASASTCTVTYRVLDLADGAVVLERGPRTPVAPASNLKLVTTTAALLSLGTEYRFTTRVDAIGELREGRLEGDLVVRAGGDPFHVQGDPAAAERLVDELARQVARAGVTSVAGDVVLDLGAWADVERGPGWPESKYEWTSSYAFVAGLTVNAGRIGYVVEPTEPGRRARARFVPAPTGEPGELDVATVDGSAIDVRVDTFVATPRAGLSGSIGASVPRYEGEFRHLDPVAYFGAVFTSRLVANGVGLSGAVVRRRGDVGGFEVARLETPWTDHLVAINTYSDNSIADAVFLTLGLERFGRADRESGAKRVREILVGLGADVSTYVQKGGSGLSRDNRVTVEMLSELLARVAREPDARLRQVFLDSLAVSGRTGTLSDRMTGRAAGRMHGKTGFINGASALSGFVTTEEGRELVFSCVVNYPRTDGLNNSCWKPMHDAIVEELVGWRRR
ncbi:MAG: D-alanyl-D-alanine carboxypeptidase/D-alanyl-D-alanine-endopeptidase [Planctomycetota bacterium]